MELFGGFMTILSIIGFFLTVIWFVLPFVIFSIKGRVDRTLYLIEDIDRRLAAVERALPGYTRPAAPEDEPLEPPR